jgi:superfamily II DNA or RNA helicase
MKPAAVFPAKNTRIHPSTLHQYPPKSELKPRPRTEAEQLDVLMENLLSASPWDVRVAHDQPHRLPAEFAVESELHFFDPRLEPRSTQGALFSQTHTDDRCGPQDLPRSYQPVRRNGVLEAESEPDPIDLLRPMLEPSVLATGSASWILPGELRSAQIEAINALLNHDVYLLADDPGTGKTVSACVALMNHFQRHQIERALLICHESGMRSIARILGCWTPGLSVTAVTGGLDQRKVDWSTPAHVYLVTEDTLRRDIESGVLRDDALHFDLIILDDVQVSGLRLRDFPGALNQLTADIRWAVAGALPKTAEDWTSLFKFLAPEELKGTAGISLNDVKQRFQKYFLRRTKGQMRAELPARQRESVWLELTDLQAKRYEEVLAEERHRLSQLGEAVQPSHIETALKRIQVASNFAPGVLDSAKVRALVDLIEQIFASDAKVVVFSQFREEGVERLHPVLEPYGVLKLDRSEPEEQRSRIVNSFREQDHWHVLLLEAGVDIGSDALVEATYIVHFDHHWNPASRLNAELNLHPLIFRAVPVNIYEFWVADTVDEQLFRILNEKNLLPGDVPDGTRPTELEDRITMDEWLERILKVPSGQEPERVPLPEQPGTGILPGTAILRSKLSELSADTLMAAVETLIKALGYSEVEALGEPEPQGGYLLAWQDTPAGLERVLVQYIASNKNIGIAKARGLMNQMLDRGDCTGAYLITTSEFTTACRSFADESEGQLALVSGSELYRHLHILGQF